MNFSVFIAKRYVKAKSSQNAVNIINFITFLVIVIGAASLFIVLSGFAGLKTFSLSFTNAFDPDLKALPLSGKTFSISEAQKKELATIDGVVWYSKEIEEKVLLQHQEKSELGYIKGVDEQYKIVTDVDSILYMGDWHIKDQYGVAGIGIVNSLGISVHQTRNPMKILALKPGKGSISQQKLSDTYNTLPLVISGVYQIEETLDQKYVFLNLGLAQALLEKDSTQISGINFKLLPSAKPEKIKNSIGTIMNHQVVVKTRQELNSTLHKMLNTENVATYLIFTLVLIIALFNVVGAIIMMILDKQQNLKTLFNLGVTIKELRRIYFIQGVIVTLVGGIIGVLIGAIAIGLQLAFGFFKIGAIDYPVAFQFINILIVLATIIILGMIASKIASSRINKKLLV